MGVSLSAYRTVVVIPDGEVVTDENTGEETYRGKPAWDSLTQTYVLGGFEHGLEGLVEGSPQSDGSVTYGPWVKREGLGSDVSFSYFEYGLVRESLCRTFLGVETGEVWSDPATFKGEPLFDLINFADNEGTLGPASCRRIANAFIEGGGDALARYMVNRERKGGESEDSRRQYEDLRGLFFWAAPDGIVVLG